jgi:hypothetical protein
MQRRGFLGMAAAAIAMPLGWFKANSPKPEDYVPSEDSRFQRNGQYDHGLFKDFIRKCADKVQGKCGGTTFWGPYQVGDSPSFVAIASENLALGCSISDCYFSCSEEFSSYEEFTSRVIGRLEDAHATLVAELSQVNAVKYVRWSL